MSNRGDPFDLAQGTRGPDHAKVVKNQQGAAMTTSETIVIGLIWALLLPGLFFGSRAAWRRRQARRKKTEKERNFR